MITYSYKGRYSRDRAAGVDSPPVMDAEANCTKYRPHKKVGEIMVMIIALAFNGLDFLTGMVKGWKTTSGLNSTKLRDGLFKKIGFVLCYLLAYLINYAGHYIDLGVNVNLLPIVCGYVILTEIVSIIENISEINENLVPDVLKKLIGVDKK